MNSPDTGLPDNAEHYISAEEALARAGQASSDIVNVDEPQIKLVIFRMQERDFAFPGRAIREVIDHRTEVYPLPGMHPAVDGVMSLHGDIQSVLCLSRLLQLGDNRQQLRNSSILLGQGAGMVTGLRIDELLDVTDIAQSLLKQPPDSLPDSLRPFVSALLELDGRPVTLLDLDLLLQAWQQAGH